MPPKYTSSKTTGSGAGLGARLRKTGQGRDWVSAAGEAASAGGGIMSLLGKAGGAVSGAGGVAFGLLGILQLLQMLGVGDGGGPDVRQADNQAVNSFLNDPMVGPEMQQMATRNALNSGIQVTGRPAPGFDDGGQSDDEFLSLMQQKHQMRMRDQMRRTPPTSAEIAAMSGLM